MRHYWLDRIIHLEPGVRATGVKAVALAEDEFDAHFPGNPVFPGVYLLEGLAQTAGVLIHHSLSGRVLAVMVSIERARFLSFARPGDRVLLEVDVESLEEPVARVRGTALVDDRTLASARFTFKLVPPDKLIPDLYQGFWHQSMETWLGRHLELDDG
ncbi:MAG TPA: 3-hydroxyacyl-ACP dehydratase FabZ family protein [Gemmatimonadales bacterium]|jgi:3-hydroxymyristoyl/3-hydroxydecanoyl-(acyl carrier protein) dehydratase